MLRKSMLWGIEASDGTVWLHKTMETQSCNLCTTTDGLVDHGELWTMCVNRNQALLGRCYFKLNHHSVDATELNGDETLALAEWFRRANKALKAVFSPDHFNYVTLMNVEPHVHSHIIPRYKGNRQFAGVTFADKNFGANFDGLAEVWLPDTDFDNLAKTIADALPKTEGRS
jgi:diadenosine tetraphosphate (Ap4A) HIT family hydrolase